MKPANYVTNHSKPKMTSKSIKEEFMETRSSNVTFVKNFLIKRQIWKDIRKWSITFAKNVTKNFHLNNSDLKIHLSEIHNNAGLHECEFCDRKCSSPCDLKKHISIVHTKEKKNSM